MCVCVCVYAGDSPGGPVAAAARSGAHETNSPPLGTARDLVNVYICVCIYIIYVYLYNCVYIYVNIYMLYTYTYCAEL